MSTPYLDKTGFAYFVGKLKNMLSSKANADLSNIDNTVFAEKASEAGAGGTPIVTTAGTGAAYTATVNGITALEVGTKITIIPHTVSTSQAPTLNVNSLGAKSIRRRVSNSTTTTTTGSAASWLAANKPVDVTYDGSFWIVDITVPNATDIFGTVAVEKGGTGATDAATARTNLGITPANIGLTTETWTFTLEDGSTVTKAVYVG